MNEWASREGRASFSQRSRVSTLVPDPFAHPMVKVLGYVWRLGLIALVGLAAYWLMFRSHLGSKEFAARLAEAARTHLGAQSAQLTPLVWNGDQATGRQFSATGGPEAPYRLVAADDVSFRVPLTMFWEPEWRLSRVTIRALQVEFHSDLRTAAAKAAEDDKVEAALDSFSPPVLTAPGDAVELDVSAPDPSLNPEPKGRDARVLDLDLRKDGLDVSPRFNRVRIGGVDAARFEAGWGVEGKGRGELRQASLQARRGADGTWGIEVASGVLSQNWLRGIKVTGLRARLRGSELAIENTAVELGNAAAVLSGRIRGGSAPEFDLMLQGENFALESFCGEPFDRFLDLKANGSLRLTGSPNLASGVTIEGTMQVLEGAIRGLAIQQALASATTRIRFREFGITGGTIAFTTGGGRLQVTSFNLASRTDVTVRGRFDFEQAAFKGELEIGVDPALLFKVAPEVQDRFFGRQEDGKRWMTVPLEGGYERLTADLAREFTEAHEAAAQAEP